MKIIGTGRALPKKTVSNDELSSITDTNDEWIFSRTGIKTRMVCTTESLTDLAETAARAALKKANLTPQNITEIICPTIAGDYSTPSLACCLAERLGVQIPAFDINAACAGFVYALDVAEKYLSAYSSAQRNGNILIVGAEMMTRLVDWSDRSTCVLFGDGAGACVVTNGGAWKYGTLRAVGQTDLISAVARAGNSPYFSEISPDFDADKGFMKMQGQHVFKFAVKAVEEEIEYALSATGMSADDVTYFILHQANSRIIDGVRARLKQPPEKFPMNIDKYANTSAASIPILLDEMLEDGRVKTGDVLVLAGFGAGMVTGTCVLVWE